MAKQNQVQEVQEQRPATEVVTAETAVEVATEQPAEISAKQQSDNVEFNMEEFHNHPLIVQQSTDKTLPVTEKSQELVECIYCGKLVTYGEVVIDKKGNAFCSDDHSKEYEKTMRTIHHQY